MQAVQGSAVTEPSSVGTTGGDFKGQRGRLAYPSSNRNGGLRAASHSFLPPSGTFGGESCFVLSLKQHTASHLHEDRRRDCPQEFSPDCNKSYHLGGAPKALCGWLRLNGHRHLIPKGDLSLGDSKGAWAQCRLF